MTFREQLLSLIDAYAQGRGLAPASVTDKVFGAGHIYRRLRDGGDVSTGNFERALRWFADHWPPETAWPDGVMRPQIHPESAA